MEKRDILSDGEVFAMRQQVEQSIRYCRRNESIEVICYRDSLLAYPLHTHAVHVTFGYVTDGCVRIMERDGEHLYHAGDTFCIPPDTPHSLAPGNGRPYSMIVLCVRIAEAAAAENTDADYAYQLKRAILQMPEAAVSIEAMARRVCVSPYHMIRVFKNTCGLTPHQFQMQCRIRKAQKLLEEGKSVIQAAYEAGFCDQSHLDRCFRKMVRLTPSAYKQMAPSNRAPE